MREAGPRKWLPPPSAFGGSWAVAGAKGAVARQQSHGHGEAALVEPAVVTMSAAEPVLRLKPGQCRGYLRREAARAFPAVVGGFLEQAKAGSCQHLRFLTEMFEETRPKRRQAAAKGLAERMVEEWLGE